MSDATLHSKQEHQRSERVSAELNRRNSTGRGKGGEGRGKGGKGDLVFAGFDEEHNTYHKDANGTLWAQGKDGEWFEQKDWDWKNDDRDARHHAPTWGDWGAERYDDSHPARRGDWGGYGQ